MKHHYGIVFGTDPQPEEKPDLPIREPGQNGYPVGGERQPVTQV